MFSSSLGVQFPWGTKDDCSQIPPHVCRHHHRHTAHRSVRPQHFRSWDAIQSLILNTVEPRLCSADKTRSRSPDARTSDIWGLRRTSLLHPLWSSCTHSARMRRVLPDTPSRTHLAASRLCPVTPAEKGRAMDTEGPFQVVGTTEILNLLICSMTSGNSEAKT